MRRRSKHIGGLYDQRPMAAGHPAIELKALEAKVPKDERRYEGKAVEAQTVVRCFQKATTLPSCQGPILVVGCGPFPVAMRRLMDQGFSCRGIEPVPAYVQSARNYLCAAGAVEEGSSEDLPVGDETQALVIMQSVLEHVDSPLKAVEEAYRVLMPGGALYASATNRLKITNAEFLVPFYQWLPALVQESYVFHQLHFEPALARYSSRPAVHWFTFSELCQLGRTAGFSRFYSKLDLVDRDDPAVRHSRLRRVLLDHVRYSPWLRSAALTQIGGAIFMFKRGEPCPSAECG